MQKPSSTHITNHTTPPLDRSTHPPQSIYSIYRQGGGGQPAHGPRAYTREIDFTQRLYLNIMARIDDYTIRRIKETAKIYDVVSDFIQLRKSGVRYTGLCPFHQDRHMGNFVVYPKKNVFKCFACDAKGGPIEFIMKHEGLEFLDAIRYLGRKYNIDTDMQDFNYTPPPPRPQPAPLPMLVLPDWMVRHTTQPSKLAQDDLVNWLRTGIKWDSAQRARFDQVLSDYRLGYSSKSFMTVFWQIDEKGNVRTGKMMRYKPDGHRDRERNKYTFDYVHSTLFRSKGCPDYSEDKQEMKQCLFGLHLLHRYEEPRIAQTVNLVESEKTAIIMAIAYGNNSKSMWMATGGMENLTEEKLAPNIKAKKKIVCWPDRDGIAKWEKRISELNCKEITINTKPVTEWWQPGDGDKADIADVVVRMLNGKRIYKTAAEVMEDMPLLKKLDEKLNLEIVEQ